MSGASVSSDVGKKKSLIWLGTFYYNLMPHSIANMTKGVIWKSEHIRPAYVDILLQFQFVRVSESDFHLTCFRCHRTPDGSYTPTGYKMQFQCAINPFLDETVKVFEMQSHQFIIIGQFSLNTYHQRFFTPDYFVKPIELKIKVNMIEYDCVPSANSKQNEYLYQLRDRGFNITSVLQDLCYILDIPRFENIYTGRQNLAFSNAKSIYIKNAAHYATEIANYLGAQEAGVAVPATDLGLIVSFVLHAKKESVNDDELCKGYIMGNLMGLGFLVKLTRDLIIMRLPKKVEWVNRGILINALLAADNVNDGYLFEKAAQKFSEWERELENPEPLFDLLKCRGIEGRFVLYALSRLLRFIAAHQRRNLAKYSTNIIKMS